MARVPTLCYLAFCTDENISAVVRAMAHLDSYSAMQRRPGRRLQSTTGEAVQAHQVRPYIDSPLQGITVESLAKKRG